MKPFKEHKEALSKSGKSLSFKDAIKQCEAFMLDPTVSICFIFILSCDEHYETERKAFLIKCTNTYFT